MASFLRKSRFEENSERGRPSRLWLPTRTYPQRPKIATASSINKFINLSLPPDPGKRTTKQKRETPGTQVAKTKFAPKFAPGLDETSRHQGFVRVAFVRV